MTKRNRSRLRVVEDTAPTIGAHADFRVDVFQRTQSLSMRSAEWEGRVQPIKRTPVRNFVANIIFLVAA